MRFALLLSLLASACGGSRATDDSPVDRGPTDTPQTDTDEPTTPTTPAACGAVTAVTATTGSQPLEQRLAVALDAPAAVWAVCTSDADPAEQHLVESTTPAVDHDLAFLGLLPETAYSCEITPVCTGAVGASAAFTTGAVTDVPKFTVTRDPTLEMSGVYTLFNTEPGCTTKSQTLLLVDPDGAPRWEYELGAGYQVDIDAYVMDPNRIHLGGGWGLFLDTAPNRGTFRDIDLSGNILLERDVPDYGLGFNHASEPVGDGTYVSLTAWNDTNGDRTWTGVGVEQWSPTDGVVWSWNSQGLVDSGYLEVPPLFDTVPYHANAITLRTDALGEAAWMSNFGLQEIWRVDKATGALTHVFGHGGDFTLVDKGGNPLPDSAYPYVQHGPDYTADGRVLVYDNGQNRPGGDESRVTEYALDLDTRVATLNWTWTEPGWYDPLIGDADYLPNGNVLVTKGFTCLTPFSNDTSALVELKPPDQVVWRMAWPNGNEAVYRSQRYDGCAVFANAKYCPVVADRIAALRAGAER